MLRIFHLDAGRKYFCPNAIASILDTMAGAGLTHLELYFSDNQGFRLALEDMTLRTDFGTYDLTACLGDGYAEGEKSPCGSGRYLTAGEMRQLLRYARARGIECIPVLNMPGHMGAILERFPHLRYPGSRSSIDLRSPEAVGFAMALLQKYLDFFAAEGCRFFHFGADEFANDLGTMGFDRIYRDGTMGQFVAFVNGAVRAISDRGMIPMAFNDGIYYGGDKTAYGPIDSRLWVCYWIHGWDTYFPASAAMLAREGFRLVNANHKFYCGMGCRDWPEREQCMEAYDPRCFDPDTVIPEPAGAMLCLWSDHGNADGPDGGLRAAESIAPVIRAFGRKMEQYDYTV